MVAQAEEEGKEIGKATARGQAAAEAEVEEDKLKQRKQSYEWELALLKKSLDDKIISEEEYAARRKELDDQYKEEYGQMLQEIFDDEQRSFEDRLAALKEYN